METAYCGGTCLGDLVRVIGLSCLLGCISGHHDEGGDRFSEMERREPAVAWRSIRGAKHMIDASSGCVKGVYDLWFECERDINEIVRMANHPANLWRSISCRLRLKHSDLSEALDITCKMPCTMTGRTVVSFKQPITSDNREQGGYRVFPRRVSETWGFGNLRHFLRMFGNRFDLVFTLSVDCYDTKKDAEWALSIYRADSSICYGLSVRDNVVCNILTQCDYYIVVDIHIVAYMASGGRPSIEGLASEWLGETESDSLRR